MTSDIVTYDYDTNDVIICWAKVFTTFSFTVTTYSLCSKHRHWCELRACRSIKNRRGQRLSQYGSRWAWKVWKSTWRFYFIVIIHIEFQLLWFSVTMLSIIIAWNVTAYACYTFECKIIRNVYMAHRYPSAIRHRRIAGASAAFVRCSLLLRVTRWSFVDAPMRTT